MTIKNIVVSIIAAALFAGAGLAAYSYGKSAGKEESQIDRIEFRLKQVETDLGEIKTWRSRLGRGEGAMPSTSGN